MTITLSEALTHLAQAATNWLERQMRGDSEERSGFHDEDDGEWVDRKQQWEEVGRLQSYVADLNQKLSEHRDGVQVLLVNYRALVTEVNALKKRGADVHEDLDHESLQGLRDLVDAVAEDQGNDRKIAGQFFETLCVRMERVERRLADDKGMLAAEPTDVRALVAEVGRLKARPDWFEKDNFADLGGPAEAIRTLMRDVIRMETVVAKLEKNQPIGQDIPLDVRAVVRDATINIEARVHTLAAQIEALEERLSQVDRQQRGWRAGIDALMGRRPRG